MGDEPRHKPVVLSDGGKLRGPTGEAGGRQLLFFETQKPIHLLKSARGGRGYLIRSELGSTTPGEDYKR